jgi:hypothetical protein
MNNRSLKTPILILALAACAARADYINSTVSLGGYFLDAKDATHDGSIYQMGRINVSALKNGMELKVAYGYSDFYEARPNTYQNSNRLSLANVSYSPGLAGLKIKAGRDFMPLVERSLYYDGGDVKFKYQDLAQGELFGGYGVPTVYQSDIADFDSDKALIGGKLSYTPISNLLVNLDGLVNGYADDGSLGGNIQGRVGDRVTISTHSVFRLDSSYFSRAELSVLTRVRKNDQFQLRYGIQEQKIDSTRNYDYFINKSHHFFLTGYLLSLTEEVNVDLNYGLLFYKDYGQLMYDDTLGQMVNFKVNIFGCFARIGQEFSTTTNAFDLKIGYSNTYWSRFRIDMAGGYTRYDLNQRKTGLEALEFSLQPTLMLGRGFQITTSYEYLHNRLYESDQRFFIGVKESFFRGLSK